MGFDGQDIIDRAARLPMQPVPFGSTAQVLQDEGGAYGPGGHCEIVH
jgi:hypothetical protein